MKTTLRTKIGRIPDKLGEILIGNFYIFMKRVYPRLSTKIIKRSLGKGLIGAEIGTDKGINAKNILENISIRKLYLIDSYEDPYYRKSEKKAKKRLKKWKSKIVFIKKRSSDAVKDIPDDLDFVYIDGDHSYSVVKEDIKNYYKKVRKNGILCGHDIDKSEVNMAFSEFIAKYKLKPYIDFQDWVVFKK
jgi:hypothetical protein